jgi:hypothetical protein
MAEVKAMSYDEWNAAQGQDVDKMAGMPGMTPERLEAYKKQLYERYLVTQGASHSDDSYQYGGQKGGADFYSKAYGGVSERSLAQQDKFYGQQEQQLANAMEDRGRALDARGSQLTAADLMMARAQGKVPSIAQMQADRQMGQLAAEQTSQAASARGPAALALAQQNQANATATGQSSISGQAQINAAMERERAEQAAFGAYSGMRGQDYQGQQLSQQGQGIALQGAGQAGQQALGYSGLQHSVNTSQLQAQGNKEGQRSADKWAQASQDQANRARQEAKEAGYMGAAATGGIALAGAAAKDANSSKDDDITSDERAKMSVGRSPGIAPQEPVANPTYEASRQAAHQALAAEEQREAKARAYGTPQTTGPATHGGIAALDRYEQDQVDTLRSKERHGVPLDAKEKRMAQAMKRGQKYGDKRGPSEIQEAKPVPADGKPQQAEKPAHESPSLLSQGLSVAKDVSKDLFARPVAPPNYSFYNAPQQQQITSDMGAKRRIGLNDFMSDMGAKLPASYSDERAKTNVSFGFGDDDGGGSRISPSRREAMEEESDPNAKWVGLMKNAPGIPTKEGPDAGYGHMFSDMGTKRAPMISDDRAKLAAAWDQGHSAALSDIEKASKMSPAELKKRQGTPAIDVTRNLKANAWDEGRTSSAMESAKQAHGAVQKAAQKEPGFNVPGSAPTAGDRLLGDISARSNRAMERVMDDEPRQLVPGTLAPRIRARAGAIARPSDEPASVSVGGGIQSSGHREDEAEMFSDERAKKAASWADAEMAKVRADDERESKRPPAVGSQRVSDDAMAQAARSMEASPYAYKPQFKPEEQAPGEVNVGPMAQKMEKSPIAATAVRRDPQTGLRSLDRDKLIKVQGGILASQQKQIDDIKAAQLSNEADRQISHYRGEKPPMRLQQRQMMAEADRQIGNYKADRPATTDARQDAMMRQADEQIRNYRAERPASVIDRGQDGPPSWLQKYMTAEGDPEEEKRTKRRLTSADFITRRRKA